MAANALDEPTENESVQNEPIQQGSTEATDEAKVSGIVEQVRHDVGMGHADDTRDELRERLAQSGVVVDDSRLDDLVRQVAGD